MDNTLTKTIAEQLTDIYLEEETWHSYKMPYEEALEYHQFRLDNGSIVVYIQNGELLGYYQRLFEGNTCYFLNAYIKPEHRTKEVFKALKKVFFETMPKNIDKIVGNKQKLDGKFDVAFIKRR